MLELAGLTKNFASNARPAVDSVSLNIGEGEFFSLLGPSGCGKTTLLRMLGGFEDPTSGKIRLNGSRIDHLPPNSRPFNMVFQRYALFPHLCVRENIAFGLKMKKIASVEIRRRVDEALALVKMEPYAERGIATLSGGQQQRVALARALVNRPKVLLLDEPLSALDLKLRQQMQVELRAIQRRLKHTFIFVTHDQEEALALSDRIAVMNSGVVEQVGSPREIYESPASLFVAQFIGSINSFEATVIEAKGTAGGTVVRGFPQKEIRSANSAQIPKGDRVRVLIRPEKIRISATPPAARENGIAVTLKETLFQGSFTQFFVQPCEQGDALWMVAEPNRESGEAPIAAGGRAFAIWDPRDCLVIAEGAEGTDPLG